MKRILLSVVVLVAVLFCGLAFLRAQEGGGGGATGPSVLPPPNEPTYHFYTNATGYGPNGDQPQSIAFNLKTYYNVQRVNLTRWCGQVPEDIMFKKVPGYDPDKKIGTGEQQSIAAECSHGANDNFNMCELARSGTGNSGRSYKGPRQDQRANEALASGSKQKVMDTLEESFKECDPLVYNFKDEYAGRIVMSQHGLQPLVTTIANQYGHAREVTGRVLSYQVVFGIKEVGGIQANDPDNHDDLIYCNGKKLGYQESLTECKAVDIK